MGECCGTEVEQCTDGFQENLKGRLSPILDLFYNADLLDIRTGFIDDVAISAWAKTRELTHFTRAKPESTPVYRYKQDGA